ncbi:MAG TPA: hypothetical protein VKA08_10045 [Balneolales bacterium]|nr:hypothetical protein [Balneolales bacterium]
MNKKDRDLHLKRFKYRVIRLLPVLFLCGLWLAGCGGLAPGSTTDSGGEKGGYYQTRILEVTTKPYNVARGDTTRITCVIEDSLNKSFIFVWQFQYGKPVNARDTIWAPKVIANAYTSGHRNYIDWIAPTDTSGYFGIGVRVDNHSDSIAVESAGSVEVK